MTMPAEPQEPRKKGFKGLLTNKIGPLQTWVWVVLIAAIILAYAWYKSSKGASTTASPTGAGAGQVPQFVNQTFTTVGPPSAPDQDQDEDKDEADKDQGPGIPPGPHRPPVRNPPPTVGGGGPPRRREPEKRKRGLSGGGPPRRRRRDRVMAA